jgi:hypothetical protein
MKHQLRFAAVVFGLGLLVSYGDRSRGASVTPCVGDCQGTGTSGIDSLVTIVGIALGNVPLASCPHGIPVGAPVTVDVIIQAVHNTLSGCPAPEATSTVLPSAADTSTPTPTVTPHAGTPTCPAGQHRACHSGSGRGGGYHTVCTCANNPPPMCVTASGIHLQAGTTVLLYDTTGVTAPDTCDAHATSVSCSATGVLSPPNATGYLVCNVVPTPAPPDPEDNS